MKTATTKVAQNMKEDLIVSPLLGMTIESEIVIVVEVIAMIVEENDAVLEIEIRDENDLKSDEDREVVVENENVHDEMDMEVLLELVTFRPTFVLSKLKNNLNHFLFLYFLDYLFSSFIYLI